MLCCVSTPTTNHLSPAAVKKLADQANATPPPNGKPIQIMDFAEIQEVGKQNPCPPRPPKPSDVAFFCYTSGTTVPPTPQRMQCARTSLFMMIPCFSQRYESPLRTQFLDVK